MKKIFYLISTVIILVYTSCLEDKDSLASRDFEHVLSVIGLQPEEGTNHILYTGDYLKLEPEIVYSPDSREEDYIYRWMIGKDTVCKDLNLNWLITRPEGYEDQKTIPGVFIIRNTVNGLEFRETFNIEIYSNLTPNYIAIYETGNGVDWISLQGKPEAFTRLSPGMNAMVNGEDKPISGKFRGAMAAKTEIALFTDQAPDYGCTISLLNDDEEADFNLPIGEIVAPIRGRVYLGQETNLNFRSMRYCEGGTRFLIMNDNLYTFNGTEKRLLIFDDQTYLKSKNVAQILASMQFMRYKKANIIRYRDNTISCFHEYNLPEQQIFMDDGSAFKLDSIYGMFTESTGLASKKPYKIYLIGSENNNYNLYEFNVTYAGSGFNVPTWSKTIPLPKEVVENAIAWFGAFSQRYGFYVTKNDIYKFDYLNITSFNPEPAPFKSFPSDYEIVAIYPLIGGTGLKDADGYTVVYLYDKKKNTTTIHVYNTITGATVKEYPDAIPGLGKDFIKC